MERTETSSGMSRQEIAALILRIGLGLVFLSGGLSKLGQLLDPGTQQAMVSQYLGPAGYVNAFFASYVFDKGISPWAFLTALSFFEVFSGVFLILGFAVRPLSLVYGFLMWTFVMSLPVVTTPGIALAVKTHTSPAMLILIRDIAISGLMFVLFNLGPGPLSLDRRLMTLPAVQPKASWDHMGLLLRIALGLVLIVGGLFHGLDHIASFSTTPWILLPLGLLIVSGNAPRFAGLAVIGVIGWYIATKLNLDKSLVSNLNGIKREFALLAAGGILSMLGGGNFFRASDLLRHPSLVMPAIPPNSRS